jgi:predicted NUDIX family phosphoesterase
VLSRRDCENDPTHKHLIPYVIITSELNDIFVVRRTEKQSEKRLHNKCSVGIGGHVGPRNRLHNIKEEIYVGMLRELKEELTGMDNVGESFDFTSRLIGFVNDDSNDVGSVHFGLVYELLVDPNRMHSIQVKETENMVGEWMNFHDALKVPNYETWSEMILKGLQ